MGTEQDSRSGEGGMKPLYKLVAYGTPVAQQRTGSKVITKKGKPVIKGGKIVTVRYDPKKSRDYKTLLQQNILVCGRPEQLIDGPIVLSCRVYRPKPKSKAKKVIFPETTPDLSNYLKAIEDALNGLVIRDDCIIVGFKDFWKLYDSKNSRIELELYRATEEMVAPYIQKECA